MAKYTFEDDRAQQFIKRFLAVLAQDRPGHPERGMTRSELEAALFASKSRVVVYLRHLRGEDGDPKRVYICGYAGLENGGRTPRYAVGNHQDASPPGTKTFAQRWAIVKASPEKHERRKQKLRADAARKRATSRPRGIFAALGV